MFFDQLELFVALICAFVQNEFTYDTDTRISSAGAFSISHIGPQGYYLLNGIGCTGFCLYAYLKFLPVYVVGAITSKSRAIWPQLFAKHLVIWKYVCIQVCKNEFPKMSRATTTCIMPNFLCLSIFFRPSQFFWLTLRFCWHCVIYDAWWCLKFASN